MAKHIPSPNNRIIAPPKLGPTSLALLNMAELVAIALGSRLRLATRSITKLWRMGESTASITPCIKLRAISGQILSALINPLMAANASSAACSINRLWVMIRV